MVLLELIPCTTACSTRGGEMPATLQDLGQVCLGKERYPQCAAKTLLSLDIRLGRLEERERQALVLHQSSGHAGSRALGQDSLG